jgi:mRNA interferase MazF
MKRGDLVTVAIQGDFGKPRPALVIQSDHFKPHSSLTILPLTSTIVNAPLLRITLQPNSENGLTKPSQVMVDKTLTVKRTSIGTVFGQIDSETMTQVERCLAVFLGIAK